MSTNTISIHADELEYTPDGLRTRGALPLQVGMHNRVVIQRPIPRIPITFGRGGFPHDSSFPTPAALAVLLTPSLRNIFDGDAKPYYQVYAHAQSDGEEADNKRLSDRRAEVMRSLLVADVDTVLAISKLEKWGPAEQQVMLRVLHCDPGPIDGDLGPLSEVAVRDFQEDYLDGIFHRHGDAKPRDPALAADGILGPKTSDALIDAFVNACSPMIDEGQLHPTHPAVGCSEFNPLLEHEPDAASNRRVTLVIHEQLPEFHDQAPCLEGDHTACPVDGEHQRCLWYRAHVDDRNPDSKQRHTDLRWLPLADGRVMLSALTTLTDEDTVEFRVHRAKAIGGIDHGKEVSLAEPLSEPIVGTVRMGVAQAIWTPSDGFDPFDVDDWYPAMSYDEVLTAPAAAWSDGNRLRPPVFRVSGGGASAISEPPGQQLHRVRFTFEDGAAATDGKTAWGLDNYGRPMQVDLRGRRVAIDGRATDEHVRVVHIEPLQYRPGRRTYS